VPRCSLILQRSDDEVHGSLGQVLGLVDELVSHEAVQAQLLLQQVGVLSLLGQAHLSLNLVTRDSAKAPD